MTGWWRHAENSANYLYGPSILSFLLLIGGMSVLWQYFLVDDALSTVNHEISSLHQRSGVATGGGGLGGRPPRGLKFNDQKNLLEDNFNLINEWWTVSIRNVSEIHVTEELFTPRTTFYLPVRNFWKSRAPFTVATSLHHLIHSDHVSGFSRATSSVPQWLINVVNRLLWLWPSLCYSAI